MYSQLKGFGYDDCKTQAASPEYHPLLSLCQYQFADEDTNNVYLRAMEERGHHSVKLAKGDAVVRILSFKVFAEEELDKAHSWYSNKGHNVEWIERPYQGRTLLTHDNFVIPVEFYFAMDRLEAIINPMTSMSLSHWSC